MFYWLIIQVVPLTINSEAAREEWKEFEAFLSQLNLDIASIKNLAEFLLSSAERSELFPLLSHLLVRGLLLPIASADCERAFSAMNRTKTHVHEIALKPLPSNS